MLDEEHTILSHVICFCGLSLCVDIKRMKRIISISTHTVVLKEHFHGSEIHTSLLNAWENDLCRKYQVLNVEAWLWFSAT